MDIVGRRPSGDKCSSLRLRTVVKDREVGSKLSHNTVLIQVLDIEVTEGLVNP